jgi:hypothetical protein
LQQCLYRIPARGNISRRKRSCSSWRRRSFNCPCCASVCSGQWTSVSYTGSSASVLVVDFLESVARQLRLPTAFETPSFAFDPDQPFGVPQPGPLLAQVRDWLVSGAVTSADGYLSAIQDVEELDGQELEPGDLQDGVGEVDPAETPRPKIPGGGRRTPACGRERGTPAEKKPTVASLASAMQQIIQSNQGLSSQLHSLTQRQQILEQQLVAKPGPSDSHPCSALHQPISASLSVQQNLPRALAKSLGTPPRTVAYMPSGLLQSPSVYAQLELPNWSWRRIRRSHLYLLRSSCKGGYGSGSGPYRASWPDSFTQWQNWWVVWPGRGLGGRQDGPNCRANWLSKKGCSFRAFYVRWQEGCSPQCRPAALLRNFFCGGFRGHNTSNGMGGTVGIGNWGLWLFRS